MGLVFQGHVLVHLPGPGVLDVQHQRPAAAETLLGQHRHGPCQIRRASLEQDRGAGFGLVEGVQHGEWRQLLPGQGTLVGRRQLSDCMARSHGCWPYLDLGENRIDALGVEHHRQQIRHRRGAVSALGECAPSAKNEQSAAPAADEVGDEGQLLGAEVAGFDAAQNQSAIGEQFVGAFGKALRQLLRIVDADPVVLVLGGAYQGYHAQVLVFRHGAAQELQLESRFPLEVEDAPAIRGYVEDGFPFIVLRQHFAFRR